jgi:lysozyme
MMEQQWLDMACNLARQFEGCRLEAYPDPSYGWQVPTIGYGATGPGIVQGTVWTQEQADADLASRMSSIGSHIDAVVKVQISPEQKGAMCDLAYNIGVRAFEHSTLLAYLNTGNIQGAVDQFMVWVKSNGVELDGLVKRRDAERALFILGTNFSGKPSLGEPQQQPEPIS